MFMQIIQDLVRDEDAAHATLDWPRDVEPSGSDEAGFVQVVQVQDRERARAFAEQSDGTVRSR